jgi:hypothetical protein
MLKKKVNRIKLANRLNKKYEHILTPEEIEERNK